MSAYHIAIRSARVVLGDDGCWYVEDARLAHDHHLRVLGPIMSVEMAHDVAEECDAALAHSIEEIRRFVLPRLARRLAKHIGVEGHE